MILAGYETTELFEIQMTMAEGIADGFNIVIGGSQNPVLEFETASQNPPLIIKTLTH
ncbi:MAG: hypothetical protein GX488_03265 [Clostridiales bacterium]|nr:hypothetical protein [Clostridiales bacterium]